METTSYQEDLAYIHHVGFGDFAEGAAPGVLALLREAGIREGLVVDLGCGSGVWARALLREGFDVLGVDRSPAMLDLARSVAPGTRFVEASLHDFALPPCAAVTALGESLGYRSGDAPISLADLFARVAESLPDGGLFVFDVVTRSCSAPVAYRSWRTGEDWAVLVEVREDAERGLLTRDITTFRRVGPHYRRSGERHVVQLWTRAEVEAALRSAGFSVRVLRRYGDHSLAPGRLAFRARKAVS